MTFEPISDHLLRSLERKYASELSLFNPLPSTPSGQPPAFDQLHIPNASATPLPGLFLSDIPTTPLTWLWPGRIPLGHLTLLDAAPDCDPSLVALTLAASISSGSPLPDGTATHQGNVILFAPYDAPADTLKPRLQAAGGDPAHVLLFRPSRPVSPASSPHHAFSLPHDLPQLAATIRQLQARLLILDPVSAIHGLTRCLPALLDIAQQTHCAILLIRSLRTPVADPLHSPGPSSPLLDAARSRLLLTPDPTNPSHHLLLTTRHLLAPDLPPILAYEKHFSKDSLPTLHWLGERDRSPFARLCTGPLLSPQRQAILRFLHDSPTPQTISAILAATSYDYEAGRKMLLRMKHAGELISPAPGLYTTANHPCLSSYPNNPPVPTVPSVPTVADLLSSLVPPVPSLSSPHNSIIDNSPPVLTFCDIDEKKDFR